MISQARDLVVKAMGLYCLVHALLMAGQVFMMPFLMGGGDAWLKYLVPMAAPIALYLLFAYVLLFRTQAVVRRLWKNGGDAVEFSAAGLSSLSFWIVLIGIFFFVRTAGVLMARLGSDGWVSGGVTVLLSLFCIFKAQAIEAFIASKSRS